VREQSPWDFFDIGISEGCGKSRLHPQMATNKCQRIAEGWRGFRIPGSHVHRFEFGILVAIVFMRHERDQGNTGTLQRWAEQEHEWRVQVVYPTWRQLQRYAPALLPDGDYAKRFHVLPRRWVVERTFSWLGRQRLLSKDYERLAATAEAMLYLAGIRLLLARLAREEK
jgi:transposase